MIRKFKFIFFLLLLPSFLFATTKDEFVQKIIENSSEPQLKKLCLVYNLSTNGSKQELKEKLLLKMDITNNKQIKSIKSTNIITNTKLHEPLIIKHADSVKYFKMQKVDEDLLVITGRVILKYKKISLQADQIAVNLKTKQVFGKGNIYLIENGKTMVGEGFYYDMNLKKAMVFNGRSVIDKILYKGENIKTLDKDFYKIQNAYFSSCHLKQPHYTLEAKQIWIYPDKTFLLLNLFYSVGGVRLFYLPLAFTTKKGTGIQSYGGYSSQNGYFIQNTYNYHAFKKNINGKLKFDYYQFKGLYGGVTFKNNSDYFKTDLSLNVAQDRQLLNTGEYNKQLRWFYNLSQEMYLNRSKTGFTKLSAYYFNTSDSIFGYDYMQNRVTKGGVAISGLDRISKNYDIVNTSQNSYSVNLTDNHGPSALLLSYKWDVAWNNNLQKFVIYKISLPALHYSIYHNFSLSKSENDSIAKKSVLFLFNNIKWNATINMDNRKIYDVDTTQYSRTEVYRDLSTGLSKTYNFFSIFTYSPNVKFGNTDIAGKNLTAEEEYNYAKASYSYINLGENYRLNFDKLLPVKSLASYLNISHSVSYSLFEQTQTEYGNLKSHTLSGVYKFAFPVFSYTLSSSANLLVKTNQTLNLLDRQKYNNVSQVATLKPFPFLFFNDSFQYSLRDNKPVINLFQMNLSHEKAIPFLSGTVENIVWNLNYTQNFQNKISSYLTSLLGFNVKFKYFDFHISTTSENRNLYVYSKSTLRELGKSEKLYRNFFTDLADSFNFFDIEKRKHSLFNLLGISLSLKHNLHCWELEGGYSLTQRKTYYPYDMNISYPYWEHSLWLQMRLVDFSDIKYKKSTTTKPPEFQ